jgi:hypothetical protein
MNVISLTRAQFYEAANFGCGYLNSASPIRWGVRTDEAADRRAI